MLTIEIEWAERNSSLPYCRCWADRWEKEEEVVMLSQKPRGTPQNDCWNVLKDRKWERNRFPKTRHHLYFALKVGLSKHSPPPNQADQILCGAASIRAYLSLSSGGKIEFPWRKEELEPGCLLQQLLGEREGRATITAAPGRWPKCQHLPLPWTPSPAWAPSAWPECFAPLAVCCYEQLPTLPVSKQQGKSPGTWKSL